MDATNKWSLADCDVAEPNGTGKFIHERTVEQINFVFLGMDADVVSEEDKNPTTVGTHEQGVCVRQPVVSWRRTTIRSGDVCSDQFNGASPTLANWSGPLESKKIEPPCYERVPAKCLRHGYTLPIHWYR